uniref:Reverse transcriptase n=1 Tax=Cannabis sativa TaxID=3483 RepID=A0A803PI15_CANSA
MGRVARKLRYNDFGCISSTCLFGGFCFMWKSEVHLQVVKTENSIFEASVWDVQNKKLWWLFGVYAPPNEEGKENFWKELEVRVNNCGLPWLIIGDLNVILNLEEKRGGRWIEESSILTQEIARKIKRRKGKGGLMAIKLDMHKAYGRMEWALLHRVLITNGFDTKSCKLIMSCVTSVFYSVLLNGSLLKKNFLSRG